MPQVDKTAAALDPGSAASRRPALDGLRGVAIALVLIHHLNIFSHGGADASAWDVVTEFMGHGVDLFFCLSGYLICQQLGTTLLGPRQIGRFWLRRAAKIIPTYFAALIVTFVVLPWVLPMCGIRNPAVISGSINGSWTWYAAFSSNLLNASNGRFTNPAIDVAWSLAVEVQFYVLVTILAATCSRRRLCQVLAFCVVSSVSARVLSVHLGLNWIQIMVLTWNRLDAFALGFLISLTSDQFRRPLLVGSILGLALLIPSLPWSRELPTVQIAGYSVVALGFSALIAEVVSNDSGFLARTLSASWLRQLGLISYSLYLTHIPIRAMIRDLIFGNREIATQASAPTSQLSYYIIATIACVLAGWTVWRYIEMPCQRGILALSRRGPASRNELTASP
jgi:peptidoglycan/LPS O-acetylase OafA/YrhL